MKKVILVLSFLVFGAYADTCTKSQDNLLINQNDKNNKLVATDTYQNMFFVDKKSIEYNKKYKIISLWRSNYLKDIDGVAVAKHFLIYNLLSNKVQNADVILYDCSGAVIKRAKTKEWKRVIPGSISETILNYAKSYLGIK